MNTPKTKKVAINVCHGGFSLSPAGVERMAELQGRGCFFFQHHLSFAKAPQEEFTPIKRGEIHDSFSWFAFDIENAPEVMPPSRKNVTNFNAWFREHEIPNRFNDNMRDNPHLIRVIEELGAASFGRFAKLKVVEIPFDVDFTIEEYDGWEHIAEKHRVWE